ncbi:MULTISPECIES: response regulator [Methylobacterium]|uniref:Regulator of RpoS n=2 Tax=Pseudomonadota TaxID=1224 RepID=A0ABQ4SYX0_9HYPH|nr:MULTISPECIES: response regulator [Methylobacterium]PIU07133.1 MAG: response regulator [Methylobacterium sp. CG09_land_8_20_14_0_10_71_15]PIU15624.1 MAG: response regulator [Methylobacterium sp. CG08_land_8_20_14_0_20_71_15]GBU18911.1 hypothetical protein AwMethylo_31260 [Methylobacterium sp.]GJE08292.1 Regulator of RpoS [Methylobacterium jeotgali]
MSRAVTLVIADADEDVRIDLSEMIARIAPGTTVIEVANGTQLNAALQDNAIDLLFVDVMLPQTDGRDIMKWQTAAGPQTMIVLLSDLLSPRWPHVAQSIGAYDVLLKPFGETPIKRLIDACRVLGHSLNLLVVDPSEASRSVIARLLAQSSFTFEITAFDRARPALRAQQRRPFDLAIIELGLPDMPGLELACQLQAGAGEVRTVMMGAKVDAKTQKSLKTFGVGAFLAKPFYFPELDAAVHQAFGLWRPYLINALVAEREKAAAQAVAKSA